MFNLLLVMLGGAIGAGLRYLVGLTTVRLFGPAFPWGTLTVNLVGGLAMGLLAGWVVRVGGADGARLFLGVGVLGGFTTFSSFGLDTVSLVQRGAPGIAFAYVMASVIGAIVLTFAGIWLMRAPA